MGTLQDNVKRVLAYSSIAHLGYILVGLIALGTLGTEAVAYYVVAYIVTLLAAFGVLTLLALGPDARERDRIEDLRGLAWERPWLAAALIGALLSLAGIPLTMGFVGKFYLIAAGVDAAQWVPVITLIVGSAIGLFYYLRIITVMCATEGLAPRSAIRAPLAGSAVLALLTLSLVALGVYPVPVIELIRSTLGGG